MIINLNNKQLIQVCNYFMEECPNDNEGGQCDRYKDCLECWKYTLERQESGKYE